MKKYKDNMFEGYLDDNQEYWDYKTSPVNGNDVIDTNHTGISFYDDFLTEHGRKYLKNEKNLVGSIIMMSPREYYEECSKWGWKNRVVPVQQLIKERSRDTSTLNHLKNVLQVYKRKLCMPFINRAEYGQEGLHRMLVVAQLFGWDHKVPVLVIDWADPDLAARREKEKKQHELNRLIEKAIDRTLNYKYVDKEDVESQLTFELERSFEYEDDYKLPDSIELQETPESFILTLFNNEYPINKKDIEWRSEEDNIDDIDLDELEDDDFLLRYFNDATISTEKQESLIESNSTENVNEEDLISVLDECNHCYYENTSMALEIICEKLYYDKNIDARYAGRSVYIGNKKIATIQVSKDGPNLVGMYNYKIFI